MVARDPGARLVPGEAWSDVALADLTATDAERREAWLGLPRCCQEVGGGKPTARWLEEAGPRVEAVGFDDFKRRLLKWFPLVDRPRTQPFEARRDSHMDVVLIPHHVRLLGGLAWRAGMKADRDLARALAALALSSYRKAPGNAAVDALGTMPCLRIVPKRSTAAPESGVFLPFEGDGTLSVILSKALMLADDRKITDPTIISQIK